MKLDSITLYALQKRAKTLKMYLTQEEKKLMLQVAGINALIVFEFYCTKIGLRNYDFADDKASKAIGLSERQVQRARNSLERHNYFGKKLFKSADGVKVMHFFLGKHDEAYKFLPFNPDTGQYDGAPDGMVASSEDSNVIQGVF